jgi:hypothetical protein
MKTSPIGLLLGFLLGTLAALAIAKPVGAGCLASCWSRSCARSYGYTAVKEPYRVTHAEWIDDDKNTPNMPYGDHIEGVDCSGLVHKTWAMENASGSTRYKWWTSAEVLPSKYSAGGFYNECSGTLACRKVCEAGTGTCPKSLTDKMDAFAVLAGHAGYSQDHVGLIYNEIDDGNDDILEAVDQSGTYQDVRIKTWNWRSKAGFRGIKRATWASSCATCQPCQ